MLKAYTEPEIAEIKRIIEKLGIKCLSHFTPVENWSSIKRMGLWTLGDIISYQVDCIRNDLRRIHFRNGICLSVNRAYSNLLYAFQSRYMNRKYLILELDKRLLWEIPCYFFPANSASSSIESGSMGKYRGLSGLRLLESEFDSTSPFFHRSLLSRIEIIATKNIPTSFFRSVRSFQSAGEVQ